MNDNAKCFIRIRKGLFEEITYKELENRRKIYAEYSNKKFIYIHKMLMEVTEEEYKEYYSEIEKNRYSQKILHKLNALSLDELETDDDFTFNKSFLEDKSSNVEDDVIKKLTEEKLKVALLNLPPEDFEIIQALYYEQKTIRKYAQDSGLTRTTVQYKKEKILEKLKKLLKS